MCDKVKEDQITARFAIKVLKKAILKKNKARIIFAYELVDEDYVNWSNPKLLKLFKKWDKLVDDANDILNS